MSDAKLNILHKCNIIYEEGTGGKIKTKLGCTIVSSQDDTISMLDDKGNGFSINRRFFIRADYYDEKSFT